MGKVITNMSMSLDGFVAGPNDDVQQLFKWYFAGDKEIPVQNGRISLKISQESAGLLGSGVRLFDYLGIEPLDLERIKIVEAPGVTHMSFRVVKK